MYSRQHMYIKRSYAPPQSSLKPDRTEERKDTSTNIGKTPGKTSSNDQQEIGGDEGPEKGFRIPCGGRNFLGFRKTYDSHTVEASTQGRRSSMEDSTLVHDFKIGTVPVRILALFDGHGGSGVSRMLQQEFGKKLEKKMKTGTLARENVERWIDETFQEIHFQSPPGGSTAVVAVIFGDQACIANVGDSRAILITSRDFQVLTEDAKPDLPKFRQEIEEQKGFVTMGRVQGMIAVARYIGNRELGLNQAVADFAWISIQPDNLLLLACDGLFEQLDNEAVMKIVRSQESLEAITTQLISQGLKSGSGDNITVLLMTILDVHIQLQS